MRAMRVFLSGCAAAVWAVSFAAPAAAQADAKCAMLLMHARGASPQAVAPLARKINPACAVRSPDMPWSARRGESGDGAAEIQKHVKELRQQGFKRVLLAGHGTGANAAIAYAGAVGDIEGVVALAPDDAGSPGPLPSTAAKMKQHVPMLWVVGESDALHAKGEAYAFAKAPPHPASRYVALKANADALVESSAKPVVEWAKALD
jgi:predicted esterase